MAMFPCSIPGGVRRLALALQQAVCGGSALSDALQAQGAFSRFYVNMVRAAEAGGNERHTIFLGVNRP